jgi:hypothetical protein
MIPIGGLITNNTMNEGEALAAVRLISPKLVILLTKELFGTVLYSIQMGLV